MLNSNETICDMEQIVRYMNCNVQWYADNGVCILHCQLYRDVGLNGYVTFRSSLNSFSSLLFYYLFTIDSYEWTPKKAVIYYVYTKLA